MASDEDIRKAAGAVAHPALRDSLESLNKLGGVVVKDGRVRVVVNENDQSVFDALTKALEEKIRPLKGVKDVAVIFTGEGEKPSPHAMPHKPKENYAHLGKVIAVLSGKGGVGKSTVAANLAVALAQKGLKVGLLDADIYGPSVPKLFGITEKPKTENNKLVPFEKYGLKLMSIGFIVDEGAPVVWRGLMVMKAIRQLLDDVAWGKLDALVIDMPPGTGDVQLTLAQTLNIAGGVVVSTPQDLALIDARKAIAMLQKMEVPILGVIENMSQFICPHCGAASHIFGHGGAKAEAQKIGVEFLGEVPLTMQLRETSDVGTPIAADSANELAQRFGAYAATIWDKATIP